MNRSLALSSLLTLALTSAACSPIKMAVPADLRYNSAPLEVDGRIATGLLVNEDFRMGHYRVHGIDRGVTTTTSRTSEGLFGSWGNQPARSTSSINFTVSAGPHNWRGLCDIDDRRQSTSIGPMTTTTRSASLMCRCRDEASPATVSMRLNSGMYVLSGSLQLDNRTLQVEGSRHMANGGMLSRAAGYLVSDRGANLAAMDINQPGALWLHRSLPPEQRDAIACAAGGLFLYRGHF